LTLTGEISALNDTTGMSNICGDDIYCQAALRSEDASNIGDRPDVSSGDRPASERYKYMQAGQLGDGANVA
jgi:hypothetical protein